MEKLTAAGWPNGLAETPQPIERRRMPDPVFKTVIVSGALANKPFNGGEAWVRLNWILGFKKLGLEVYFVEQLSRDTCVDASNRRASFEDSVNLAYFNRVVRRFGLADSAGLIYNNGEVFHGLGREKLFEIASASDLLVNISGHLNFEPMLRRIRRKIYIDIDPGFTQFWHAQGISGLGLENHDFHFSIGANVGAPGCPIPTCGIHWRKTRPPVVLDYWPVSSRGAFDRFTTVGSWRGAYGPVEYEGNRFGLKVHEFRRFIELPRRSPRTFEIALQIHPEDEKDLSALRSNGWGIADPARETRDPDAFQSYIQASSAEFSAAQSIYVQTGNGWFSDRTACYLASGKPALVQDTGWGQNQPEAAGLLTFQNLEDAVAGAERIAADYEHHCLAARSLAEEYFDSGKVLFDLLEALC